MTQATSHVDITPGAGANIASIQLVAGSNTVQYQVVMVADESGHVQDSLPTYFYMTPPIAVGASKLWVDLFNATGSGKIMDIRGIWITPNATVAVTGVVSVRLDLYRTSAVGTGGTAASSNSATVDVAGGNFTKFDENNADIPSQITARVAPAGGATISRWLFQMNYFPEETNPSVVLTPGINWVPTFSFGQKITVRENTGILIKQGTVASVGSAAILIAFTLQ